jgi:predicted nucleotidyltransferase
MNGLITQLKKLSLDLNRLDIKWALVGSMACGIYTDPRTTRDIDISVIAKNKNAQEEVIQKLLELGYHSPQILMLVGPTRIIGQRIQMPSEKAISLPIDLIFNSTGIEESIVENAKILEIIHGIKLPVASLGDLIAMKIISQNDSDRLKDRVDLRLLINKALESDLKITRKSLKLIQERMNLADKNLQEDLDYFLEWAKKDI